MDCSPPSSPSGPEVLSKGVVRDPSLIEQANNGTRKVSAALITPPSSLSTSRSASAEQEVESKTILVPVLLYSAESYQFLGFTAERAHNLFKSFNPDDDSLDLAKIWIMESSVDALGDWYGTMNELGFNPTMQAAIMDPEHAWRS
ncbi:hypothetical protein BDV95DRAFT_564070 [Massariosphaeria phaeospora]|uniref:Uncharacterized protein n=1 Tax=Massariosphaeria phaeospora TaxID=100035 RepID=A0A7C8IIE6_9PLEO|nr:hypothetical protein BDV95DRAFT_564070 [Massariosphaeria phaeospora]